MDTENEIKNNFRRPLILRKLTKRSLSKDSNINEKQIISVIKKSNRSLTRKIQENLQQYIKKEIEYNVKEIKSEVENLRAVIERVEKSRPLNERDQTITHTNRPLLSQIFCDMIFCFLLFGSTGLFLLVLAVESAIERRAIYLITGLFQIIFLLQCIFVFLH